MQKTLFCVLLLVAAVLASQKDEFDAFLATHNKFYTTVEEYEARFLIFTENMKNIIKHNLVNDNFKLGVNQFADMTNEEYREKMLSEYVISHDNDVEVTVNDVAPPASVDWRTRSPPAVAPVRNLGSCGGSNTYAVVDAVAGEYAVAKKEEVYNFELETIVKCDGTGGCTGSLADSIWTYIKKYGLLWYYDGKCPTAPGVGLCIGGSNCTTTEDQLMNTVATKGPVSVYVDASQTSFQLYTSGVYADAKCTTKVNLALQVVGYGTTNGQDYWIARNEWGTGWGMKGDILIARGKNACGIASHACSASSVGNCVC